LGRPVFYRQRICIQAASVKAKSLLTRLASEIRSRQEIFPEGAWLEALGPKAVDNYLRLLTGC